MVKFFKSKTFLITIGLISLLAIIVIQKKDVIFQEESPVLMAVAMSKMIFQNKEIVEVKETDGTYGYLVKRGEMEPYIKMMENDGWLFMGRDEIQHALKFQKGNTTQSVAYQYYTRWYTIIFS